MSDTAEFFHPQRELSQVSQEQKELLEKLRDEAEQKEQLRKLKNEMESERWHLDKTIEKLQKEVRGQAAEQRQVGPGEPSASSCKGSGNPSSPSTDALGWCRDPAAIPWTQRKLQMQET